MSTILSLKNSNILLYPKTGTIDNNQFNIIVKYIKKEFGISKIEKQEMNTFEIITKKDVTTSKFIMMISELEDLLKTKSKRLNKNEYVLERKIGKKALLRQMIREEILNWHINNAKTK